MFKRIEVKSQKEWNQAIAAMPGVSILQTWEWGQVKNSYGWSPRYFLWKGEEENIVSAALILIKEIRVPLINFRFHTMYVPQGPLMDWTSRNTREAVLDELRHIAEEEHAFFIKIDPEVVAVLGESMDIDDTHFLQAKSVCDALQARGFTYSQQQIQFKNTAWMDLSQNEDDLLAAMKQKTRYNIRLSSKKGVTIRQGTMNDLDLLYQMYLDTSIRDGFIIRPKEYYTLVWSTFMQNEMALPLIAEFDNQPVAGLMLFYFAARSWYLYGMSTNAHRDKMPNYLLQWEAIRISRQKGCKIYDMWGAPDNFNENDNMWGVYRFKKGLGAQAIQRIGAYDLPLNKFAYKIFVELLPRLQFITRRIRKAQQIQELN